MRRGDGAYRGGEDDTIRIAGLEVYARHGVFTEERKLGQKFYVNALLNTDTRAAGQRDALELSTDYGAVCEEICRFLTEHTYALLEAAAEHLAEDLLLLFPRIKALELEIQKPSAPIRFPFDYVSVSVRRGWRRAVIACGSNMGDKEAYLRGAERGLSDDEKCRLLRSSSLRLTKPYGGVEQDDFLNGAFLIETLYEPEELLMLLQRLEKEAGRERLVRWGPRTLDLDIISYEDAVVCTDTLTIPHPDLRNRDFVLRPLSELTPQWVHPLYQKTAVMLLEELEMRNGGAGSAGEKE